MIDQLPEPEPVTPGCYFCAHRASEAPQTACGLRPPRTFPRCPFTADYARLYDPEHIE